MIALERRAPARWVATRATHAAAWLAVIGIGTLGAGAPVRGDGEPASTGLAYIGQSLIETSGLPGDFLLSQRTPTGFTIACGPDFRYKAIVKLVQPAPKVATVLWVTPRVFADGRLGAAVGDTWRLTQWNPEATLSAWGGRPFSGPLLFAVAAQATIDSVTAQHSGAYEGSISLEVVPQ